MNKADLLRQHIINKNHQTLSIKNLIILITDHFFDSIYILKKFGIIRLINFWYTKLFIVDEGGEFDLRASYLRKHPNSLKLPRKIEIEHTTICNKKCIFCSHNHPNQKIKQTQMPYEKFVKIIDDIPSLRWVNLAGIGSNFLHKNFIGMLEYLSKKNINVNFVDEFDFFTEEHSRKIIELGVHSIYISFDGATKKTYEKIKKGCNFDRALENIKTLLRLKEELKSPFPILHFRFIINKYNYKEMPEFLDLIYSLKNRGTRSRVEFIGLIVFPGIEKYYLPIEKLPEDIVISTYEKALKNNINLYFSHTSSELSSISECVRWSEPFILVSGEVIQCCAVLMQTNREFLKKLSFGNSFKQNFKEIWKSDRYTFFREQIITQDQKVPIICLKCCSYNTRDRSKKYGISE
jgi:MoaA/NifB/PqqE/SkfB family radical SAM enzyme